MNRFSVATIPAIENYKKSTLGIQLCGNKPFGSRHWEYPWALENSGLLEDSGQRVLDIAPDFTFPYARFLESLGHRITFIDLEKQKWSEKVMWGIDKDQAGDNFQVMDVRSMTFPDESFDCILCISVLEHIVCPTQDPDHPSLATLFDPLAARPAISEMKRCLKPRGKLILTVDLYGGAKWKPFFDRWDIFVDLKETGFQINHLLEFDREQAFCDKETFLSQFYGPYITLGFCLTG